LTRVEVHHIFPVHLVPGLELVPTNLITLCRPHHFELGHHKDWADYNPDVRHDAAAVRQQTRNLKWDECGDQMKTPAIIVDLDGTLCDCRHRRHHVERPAGEKKDWKSFFAEMPLDKPNPWVAQLINCALELGGSVLLVSGRGEEHRPVTVEWLNSHLPEYADGAAIGLLMRPLKDRRPDTEVKREIYENLIKHHYDVKLVLDDRSSVVAMWRSLGLECWQVAAGDF
jgi:predicted secreted acid phosphatase